MEVESEETLVIGIKRVSCANHAAFGICSIKTSPYIIF